MIPLPEHWAAISSERVKRAMALGWETEQDDDGLWLAWSPDQSYCGMGDSEFMALWDLVSDPMTWDDIGAMLAEAV